MKKIINPKEKRISAIDKIPTANKYPKANEMPCSFPLSFGSV